MRDSRDVSVYESLDSIPASIKPTAVTIGVFDGVHLGHRSLMRSVAERAAAADATPVVVTFDRHPLEVIAPGKEPPMLSTLRQRIPLMGEAGMDAVVILPFDDALRTMSPEDFVRRILVDALGCVHVVVGANFRFGHMQAGNIETLNDLGQAYGFGTTIFALVDGAQEVVSSSMIRRHVADGLVERVAVELDRPYRIAGTVVHGAGRGKGLGFPTANVDVDKRVLLPKVGVYAGWVLVSDVRQPALINVGFNPTFEDRATPVVEAYLLDFAGDLYGKQVEVAFTHRLRDEQRFGSAEELVRQIQMDETQGRELLGL